MVGTLGSAGPRLTPVWYEWDGEKVLIWSGPERRWVQELLADPRVAFSVHGEEEPYPAVIISGRADVLTRDTQILREPVKRIIRRYVAEEGVDDFLDRYVDVPGVTGVQTLVTIRPRQVRSWMEAS